ncbi:tetratricopeptide repeat protein [Candidatus Viridilinea mediisalina]|uniref:DUF2325 domain-containing protein n=1 Tax=Candidatus Viridilinea mediisalina TaxID=2024553 RepID=A0A2A6RI99_9CHLR|nr:tetratricopeptide repeat protein [Candidatus Viridilinea mediisalina]PDW02609.1 hypothetical protein CJ255_13050 [Candidatus Viridilinea mediisalina]
MTIDYLIDPKLGWEDQIGLRLRCTSAEAQALHRALRMLLRGRMSPLLPGRQESFPFTILIPATQEAIERRWNEILDQAGLGVRQAPTAPTEPSAARLPNVKAPPAPTRIPTGGRATTSSDLAWEQRFRRVLKVLASERRSQTVSYVAASFTSATAMGPAEETDEIFLASLPPSSRLRAQIARYAERSQDAELVSLCTQRHSEVLALPPSALLVNQILDAHEREAQRCADTTIAAMGRELCRAFLPELERLRQAEKSIRERLRDIDAAPDTMHSAPVTISEQIAALIALDPVERLPPLQKLHTDYPAAQVIRLALANTHALLDEVDQALELYRTAEPANEVVEQIVPLLLKAGRKREALEAVQGQAHLNPRLTALHGATLLALGEATAAQRLLTQAWEAGERAADSALAYARALVATGDLARAAEPYLIARESTPTVLTTEDCRAMADIALGGGYGDLTNEEQADYLDHYVARAGRQLREQQDAATVLHQRVTFRRTAAHPERLREALADWLEYLAETSAMTDLDEALRCLHDLRREGALTRTQQFDLLEGIERFSADLPGVADLLALEYQALAVDELAVSLRQGEPLPAYISDLRRALHFLNRELADDLSQTVEQERTALHERSLFVPEEVVTEVTTPALTNLKLTIIGGHGTMRREVEQRLRQEHGLTDYLEVAPSSEAHVDRAKVRERVSGRDLIVVVTGYIGHDLSNLVRDLQQSGEIVGRVLWTMCRGKSGVLREIIKSLNSPRISVC